MEAKSIFSSTTLLSSSLTPSFPAHDLNKRKLMVVPFQVDKKQWSGGFSQRSFRLCSVMASLRGNLEVPTSVPVRVAHELLLAGHRYLDVRTPEEYSNGHVVGAINIPYMYKVGSGMSKNPKFLEQVSKHFGKYDEILVGCQLGKRSMMAATDLFTAGYTSVTDVAGGYAAWTQNRLPTEN